MHHRSAPVGLDAAQQLGDGQRCDVGQGAAQAAPRQLLDVHPLQAAAVCRWCKECSIQAGGAKLVDQHCPNLVLRLQADQAAQRRGLARRKGTRDDVHRHGQLELARGGHRRQRAVAVVGGGATAWLEGSGLRGTITAESRFHCTPLRRVGATLLAALGRGALALRLQNAIARRQVLFTGALIKAAE